MKPVNVGESPSAKRSLPVRGAWIETTSSHGHMRTLCRSPCGERGLKHALYAHLRYLPSLPVRGAWIETL